MLRLTKEQRKALHAKYQLNPSGHQTYRQFRATVRGTIGMDGAIVVHWASMWVAIEKDGYAHT